MVSSAKESFDYLNDILFEPAESENIELLISKFTQTLIYILK